MRHVGGRLGCGNRWVGAVPIWKPFKRESSGSFWTNSRGHIIVPHLVDMRTVATKSCTAFKAIGIKESAGRRGLLQGIRALR
jgi:hypothetical protein